MGCRADLFLHRYGKPSFALPNRTISVCFQARNIVNYLRVIHRILAWVASGSISVCYVLLNSTTFRALERVLAGPLLWHFGNNDTNDPSIELDLEEVKVLVRQMGFWMSVRLRFLFLPLCQCVMWFD